MSSAMNGVVFQMSTISTAIIAVSAVAVQAILLVDQPEAEQDVVEDAELVVEHPAHILAETMVGIAQGMRIAARTRPRP